LLAIQLVD